MISERQGPTRSEQTNHILSMCQGALEGRVSDDSVRASLDAREQALDGAKRAFAADAAAELESAPNAEMWQPFVDVVIVGFDEYKKALGALRGTLRAKGEPFEEAMAALTLATERLFLATDAYQARIVSEGPSRFPMQNFLSNMTAAVRRGDLPHDAYAEILTRGRTYFQNCLKEMENAPESEPQEAIARFSRALQQCLDALLEMERFLQDRDTSHLEKGLEMLEKGQADVDEGFALHRQQRFAAGPTSSPVANTFISAAGMVKTGQYPVEVFENDVNQLEEHLRKIRGDFENACQVSTTSMAIQEEIPRAIEAFDIHQEAIEAYRRYVEHRNPADLDQGNAQLIEAMRRLDEAKATFESVSEREGKAVCPRCGAANDPSHRVCGQCNAALPRVAPSGPSSFAIGEEGEVATDQQFVITENTRRVIEDTNRVAAGDITPELYNATLDWMDAIIVEGETSLSSTPHLSVEQYPEDERERALMEKGLIDETREMLAEGLQRMRSSLEELRVFTVDGDQQHLIDGLKAFWEASQEVYRVKRIGELAARAAIDTSPEPIEESQDGPSAPM